MRIKKQLLEIGYDKNGELDFGVSCLVGELTIEKLKELREMIVVTIYVAEDMWRRKEGNKTQSQTANKG